MGEGYIYDIEGTIGQTRGSAKSHLCWFLRSRFSSSGALNISHPLEILEMVLCGRKRKDSDENITHPSIDRKLTFVFSFESLRCFLQFPGG